MQRDQTEEVVWHAAQPQSEQILNISQISTNGNSVPRSLTEVCMRITFVFVLFFLNDDLNNTTNKKETKKSLLSWDANKYEINK